MSIPAVCAWRTNAHLIEAVAEAFGYLDGLVVDVTYGRGRWWALWRPERLVTLDYHYRAHVRGDFRALPLRDGAVDAVAFDPPYKLNGTPRLGDFDNAYGLDVGYVPWRNRHAGIRAGITEAARALRSGGHLLLKCQDQVCGGKMRWQTVEFTIHAATVRLELVDRFDMLGGGRSQPAGTTVLHARGRPSSLLVFRKVGRR